MCPDIIETKLKFEREREWKPDPQVINKWTVLYNLQKDYLQRIKPGLDGIKNYQDILTDKIRKEKQEKENLQNLIQFQNKVNVDLRKGDEPKNNSFDADDNKCDDEELKYKNNKIIGSAKNDNFKKNEVDNLAQKNNIKDNSKNESVNNNDDNGNSSDKPNLFAFNKKMFNDFKNTASFDSAYNNNNSPMNNQPSGKNSDSNGSQQSEKKLNDSNINKLKSAMASFFNKNDKAAFKFSETNSEIKSENANEESIQKSNTKGNFIL